MTDKDWRKVHVTDLYGYTVTLEESGDGHTVHVCCRDDKGRSGRLATDHSPPTDPPKGTVLVSYGGGYLDPQGARQLAAALLAYADEKDGTP